MSTSSHYDPERLIVAYASQENGLDGASFPVEPAWLRIYDVHLLERYHLNGPQKRKAIQDTYSRYLHHFFVSELLNLLTQRGLSDPEIAQRACVVPSTITRWSNAEATPSWPEIDRLMRRSGLTQEQIKVPPRIHMHMRALIRTLEHVKVERLEEPAGPEPLNAEWIQCFRYVETHPMVQKLAVTDHDYFARQLLDEAKQKVSRLSDKPIMLINQMLNRWLHVHYMTVHIILDLFD